jgi:hypothetical protein
LVALLVALNAISSALIERKRRRESGPEPAPHPRNPPSFGPCCPASRAGPRQPRPGVSLGFASVRERRHGRLERAPGAARMRALEKTGDTSCTAILQPSLRSSSSVT